MPRVLYRTSKVHSCFSQDLHEPRPASCRCRKLISRAEADEKVSVGEAEWLIDYSSGSPLPSWDIVLTGRRAKVPRAATLEKSHIQRGVEASDLGLHMREMNEDISEVVKRDAVYADILVESKILLFPTIGQELLRLKRESDKFGTLSGEASRFVVRDLLHKADKLKFDSFIPGPEGPVLSMIGLDERTQTRGK